MHQTLTIDGHLLAIEPEGDGHVLRLIGPDGGQRIEIAPDRCWSIAAPDQWTES